MERKEPRAGSHGVWPSAVWASLPALKASPSEKAQAAKAPVGPGSLGGFLAEPLTGAGALEAEASEERDLRKVASEVKESLGKVEGARARRS